MNRVEFVGNAIFIPFFLIGVGMLIDYRAFFKDLDTIWVASVMIAVATSAKFIAAWITQKSFKFSKDERRLIFGLSNAQAAATLAAVLVGYNIILNQSEIDQALLIGEVVEPKRLLNDAILNGTILMILFTCTIASFVAQKGAKNIALLESSDETEKEHESAEKILIPISNIEITDELVNLGVTVKSKKNKNGLFALSIVDNNTKDSTSDKNAKKILDRAAVTASATDNQIHELLRYDLNIVNGISSVIREHKITDLILGLHSQKGISNSFLGNLTEGILTKCNTTTLIYKPAQPFATIKRHLIIVPENAEKEIGFPFWLIKLWNIARNSGAKLVFYAGSETILVIQEIQSKHPIQCEFEEFSDWEDFLILSRNVQDDDNLIIILSRKDKPSFQQQMTKMPQYLNKYFVATSYILIYPMQIGVSDTTKIDLKNPTFIEPFEKLDEIGKSIAKIFKRMK
jgi:nucleotide-binding universal stress UspA family protein